MAAAAEARIYVPALAASRPTAHTPISQQTMQARQGRKRLQQGSIEHQCATPQRSRNARAEEQQGCEARRRGRLLGLLLTERVDEVAQGRELLGLDELELVNKIDEVLEAGVEVCLGAQALSAQQVSDIATPRKQATK